jgi:hypothetical protein
MSRPWLRVLAAQEAKLVAAGGFENESERHGICITAALSAAGLDVVDPILDAMVDNHALTGDSDIAIPVHVVAVGELGDESLGNLGQD